MSDIEQALKTYKNKNYATLPIGSIQYFSDLKIPRSKRNGRTREAHMKRVNKMIDFDISMGEKDVRYHGGAPTKEEKIKAFAAANPGLNHSQIARALGVSRPTVIKWLKS
jgi:hypothetical protein